ncbi:MAG TPA: GNAT family N-acetyltransferase [Nostocaceae cyanobacterium]|nr:GNAT family N-acetyltransferase [Nostocaceae cyanobacterium]
MNNLIIKIVNTPEEFTAIQQIRIKVFQQEQGVEPALEFDGKDDISTHLIAYLDNQPIGTTRIRYINEKTAKLERLAVLPEARGQGIGKQIIEKSLQFLTNKNISQVVVHSQEYIKNLYVQLGFIPEGEIFFEAAIPHIKMSKKLVISH